MPTVQELKDKLRKKAEARGLGWLYQVYFKGQPVLEYLVGRESGWQPAIPSGYNARGTEDSHGLFQLNRQGGVGAGHSIAELQDPDRNMDIALDNIAANLGTSGNSLAAGFQAWDNPDPREGDPEFHTFLTGGSVQAAGQEATSTPSGTTYAPPKPEDFPMYETRQVPDPALLNENGEWFPGIAPAYLEEKVPIAGSVDWGAYSNALEGYQYSTGQLQGDQQDDSLSALVNYTEALIRQYEADIAAHNLRTNQATDSFKNKMDVWDKAAGQLQAMQQYTIPKGAEYVPGYEPEGPAVHAGRQPIKVTEMNKVEFNPFAEAVALMRGATNLEEIGAPAPPPELATAMGFLESVLPA